MTTGPAPRLVAPTGAARTRFGAEPRYAEGLHEIGPGVYAWLVPNGSWGEANAGLIVGDGASCLVDTLWDARLTRAMLDAMAPVLATAPIRTVLNTHADGDHWWGNGLLDGAAILATERARADMHVNEPRTMRLFAGAGRFLGAAPVAPWRRIGRYFAAMCAPYAFGEAAPQLPTRTFAGEITLDIGGRAVRAIEAGPAHTAGDAMVHVPDAGVLFAGDLLFIGSTPVMWAGPVENWLKALDLMDDLKADIIVPGHGPLTDGEGVALVRRYWTMAAGEAKRHYAAGLTASEAARAILAGAAFADSPFADWDSPERIMTNVHMLYRQYGGRRAALGTGEKVAILARQALLAHELAGDRSASMRRPSPVRAGPIGRRERGV